MTGRPQQALPSLGKIYAWTFAAMLVPCWVGQALFHDRLPAPPAGLSAADGVALAGLLLFAVGCFGGVSVGSWLVGRRAYAVIGGVGRAGVFALAALLEWVSRTNPPGHAYLVALGAFAVMAWVLFDLVWLWRVYRRRSAKQEVQR